MKALPEDPAILVSSINMLLRDGEFDNLEQLCWSFSRDAEEVKAYLRRFGYVYSEQQKQMRPEGYDGPRPDRHAVESAYCFFHQKLNVYARSGMEWQKDDIEDAIARYTDMMSPALYASLAQGRDGFLREHAAFADDLEKAVARLETMMRD